MANLLLCYQIGFYFIRRCGEMRKVDRGNNILRASFGKIGYINIPSLNTGSVSKSVYNRKNPKKLKDAIKKASETLDKLYAKHYE